MYDNRASPVSWDPGIVLPGTRMEIFQVTTFAGRPEKQDSGQHTVHTHCFPVHVIRPLLRVVLSRSLHVKALEFAAVVRV